jgi:hypothetical protein
MQAAVATSPRGAAASGAQDAAGAPEAAAALVDAAGATRRGGPALGLAAAAGGALIEGEGMRAVAAASGTTMLATLSLPAGTAFGSNAAISPPAVSSAPANVLVVATSSFVIAGRWTAGGVAVEPGLALGPAAVGGLPRARAFDAVRFFMPAQVLGLAPGWASFAGDEDAEGGGRGWKVTAAVSFVATVVGYHYCNTAALRRQNQRQVHGGQGPARRGPVQRARRIVPGSHAPGERELVAG